MAGDVAVISRCAAAEDVVAGFAAAVGAAEMGNLGSRCSMIMPTPAGAVTGKCRSWLDYSGRCRSSCLDGCGMTMPARASILRLLNIIARVPIKQMVLFITRQYCLE